MDISWVDDLDPNGSLGNLLSAIEDDDDNPFEVNSSRSVITSNPNSPKPRLSYDSRVTQSEFVRKTRRRRQLPRADERPSSRNGMRRCASLSYLPSLGGQSSNRRLPELGQGKLVQQVASKLELEAQLRLRVVNELKEERKIRYDLEDQLKDLRNQLKETQTCAEQRLNHVLSLQRELDLSQSTSDNHTSDMKGKDILLERKDNEIRRLEEQLNQQEENLNELHSITQQAFDAVKEETAKRMEAEDKLAQLCELLDSHQPGASEALLSQLKDFDGTSIAMESDLI